MTRRILMAYDGSGNSEVAVRRAIEFFGSGYEYHALYVYTPGSTIRIPEAIPPHAATGGLDPEPELERTIEKREWEYVERKLQEIMESSGIEFHLHTRRGGSTTAHREGCNRSECRCCCDRITRHGSISRLLLGSVSSFVVQHAPVSTFVVR